MLSSRARLVLGRRRLFAATTRTIAPSTGTTNRGLAAATSSSHHTPVPQSSQAVLFEGHPSYSEGWESTIKWWYSSSFVLICLILGTTPSTDIAGWAQHEAAARLQLQQADPNMTFTFGQHYQNVVHAQIKQNWDSFSKKAMRMTNEDDDEEEEEESEDDDE